MYFYIYKIKNNEIEQNILLEMCSDACLSFGNGRSIYAITTYSDFKLKVAGQIASATFLFCTLIVT